VSPYEVPALINLAACYNYAYAAYFNGSHSDSAYTAYINSYYALAYAQLAARTHSATDWYYAYVYANAVYGYAYQDWVEVRPESWTS
jgi:hypothetical protein